MFCVLTGCAHTPKSPNANLGRSVPIAYSLPYGGRAVALIKDETGTIVKNLIKGEFRGKGENSENWDGVLETGSLAGPGNYSWEVAVEQVSLAFDRTLASVGSKRGAVFYPQGVAVDEKNGKDFLYVTDSGNQRVQELDADGDFLREFDGSRSGKNRLNNPWGIAVSFGQVYVSDKDNHRIVSSTSTGIS